MRADISDNLNQMIDSIDGISEHWDEIVLDEEYGLREKCIAVLERVNSMALTIQLLLKFNAIWLSDSEHEILDDIVNFVVDGINELDSINKESN